MRLQYWIFSEQWVRNLKGSSVSIVWSTSIKCPWNDWRKPQNIWFSIVGVPIGTRYGHFWNRNRSVAVWSLILSERRINCRVPKERNVVLETLLEIRLNFNRILRWVSCQSKLSYLDTYQNNDKNMDIVMRDFMKQTAILPSNTREVGIA
jgi:hypothetical protein